jgi:hypothetical protein
VAVLEKKQKQRTLGVKARVHCGGMVMGDLKDCIQLGVATSPYAHTVVIGIPYNALISLGMEL